MMKKILFLLSIAITITFAETTNQEIVKKLDNIQEEIQDIKENQKLMKQEMKLRFEAIDKRFEMMNENFNKRFEAIDKRFEMMNENFNKRFEAMQNYMDKRFETLTNFMMALVAGIFGLIGFMMWDRRTVVERAKSECAKEVKESEEFHKKADKEYVDRLVKAMNELLVLKDETAINVFKKYGLL